MTSRLIKNSYGKEEVRLTHVSRSGPVHEVHQMSVGVELEGDFTATYLEGDNRQVIATDSMKNTVYVLARDHRMTSVEEFARDLADHFLSRYPQVSAATVRISQQLWHRMVVGGNSHPLAFTGGQGEVKTCAASHARDKGERMAGGIDGLLVLKTSNSAFRDFVRDEFTTLPDAEDRIFSTVIKGEWTYREGSSDWAASHELIRGALLETFAGHKSFSVQQTLYAMAQAALEQCREIEEISLVLPNKHHLPVDLRPFGKDNPGMIFMPVDEPYGCIRGTVRRED